MAIILYKTVVNSMQLIGREKGEMGIWEKPLDKFTKVKKSCNYVTVLITKLCLLRNDAVTVSAR